MILIRPVAGTIMNNFGASRPGGRRHEGVDIPAATGTPIYAAASGRVFKAGPISSNAGLGVEIHHDGGVDTKYFHMYRVQASVGQYVSQGQQIGLVGSTGDASGPHLHLELWVGGRAVNPFPYLNGLPLPGSNVVPSVGAEASSNGASEQPQGIADRDLIFLLAVAALVFVVSL
jgi:murein DD-endopeptidase MepM/ murein hydrolase activator NlpD